MARDPGYYSRVPKPNYLLPKWYGRPGDTEKYAAQVADALGGREGAGSREPLECMGRRPCSQLSQVPAEAYMTAEPRRFSAPAPYRLTWGQLLISPCGLP